MDRFLFLVRLVVVGGPFACMFIVIAIIGLGPAFLEIKVWWRQRCGRQS